MAYSTQKVHKSERKIGVSVKSILKLSETGAAKSYIAVYLKCMGVLSGGYHEYPNLSF